MSKAKTKKKFPNLIQYYLLIYRKLKTKGNYENSLERQSECKMNFHANFLSCRKQVQEIHLVYDG